MMDEKNTAVMMMVLRGRTRDEEERKEEKEMIALRDIKDKSR